MRRFALAAIAILLMSATPAHADVISDWNQNTIEVLKAGNVLGNPWSRAMAMVHVAMSDAVNSVQPRYTRYVATAPVAPNVSPEAAAVSAARHILIQVAPAQKSRIDEMYADSLSRIADGAAKTDGIALGEQVAALIQSDRATDLTNAPDTYRPITAPGVWVPTQPPLFPQYAQAKPWGMKSADQFRPGPPPQLTSAVYARDYNETKELGGTKSTKRTPQQTDAVRFWTQLNFGPSWNEAARQLSAWKGLNVAENARVFALLNIGIANTFIADWDAKFHYNFWRPVTAIRNGDMDGNDATERDAGWTPLNATPMHPEYPSQAAIQAGAALGVLESVFGPGPVSGVHGDGYRRSAPAAAVHQSRANGRRATLGARVGGHPLPQHAGGQRADGPKDRRASARHLHDAGAVKSADHAKRTRSRRHRAHGAGTSGGEPGPIRAARRRHAQGGATRGDDRPGSRDALSAVRSG